VTTSPSAERIPSLDGLRAISITLVLLGHLAARADSPCRLPQSTLSLGSFGVTVFFVISGFLITGLLLDELRRTQRIRLGGSTSAARCGSSLRISALLIVVAAAGAAGWIALNPGDLLHGATYTSNYHDTRSWYVGHTWSLSVEEQFYLLWPAVLLLARTRRALFIAAATILVVPLSPRRGVGAGASAGPRRRVPFRDDRRFARRWMRARLRAQRLHAWPLYMRALSSPAFVLVPAVAVLANLTHDHPLIAFGAAMTVINICLALCVDWAVTFHEGRIGRVLNAAPLVFVGWISYSLYLWQQPFLNRESTAWSAAFPATSCSRWWPRSRRTTWWNAPRCSCASGSKPGSGGRRRRRRSGPIRGLTSARRCRP
jgi:peptidoglycan/LPS O-acetylase OafA/YrhL